MIETGKKSPPVGFHRGAREALREFGENTTLHGIRYVTEPNAPAFERFCWVIAILTCSVLCGHELAKVFVKWQESPVITVQAQTPTLITSIPFPAVTICPENKVLRSVLDVEKKLDWMMGILNGTITNVNKNERLLAETVSYVCDSEEFQKRFFNVRIQPTETHRRMIPKIIGSLDDIFSHCEFQATAFDCSKLFRPILTEDGQCFTFNMLQSEDIYKNNFDDFTMEERNNNLIINKSSWTLEYGYKSLGLKSDQKRLEKADSRTEYPWREQMYLGPASGLHVFLKTFKNETQDICSLHHNAENFKVILHSPVEYPVTILKYFHVAPDTQAMVSVRPVLIDADPGLRPPRYNPEVRGCIYPEERPGFILKNLTETNCIFDIFTEAAVRECNCSLLYMPIKSSENRTLEYCKKGHFFKCQKFLAELDHCLPSCHEIRYLYHVSYSNFYGQNQSCGCNSNRDHYTTKISIFFEEAAFFAMKKSELYGRTDFIASCGGLFGLFSGFSVISGIEVCYFATIRLWCRLHERRKNRDIDVVQDDS